MLVKKVEYCSPVVLVLIDQLVVIPIIIDHLIP